jgi:uncharacterized alpha-E superfamily protein
MVEIPDDITPHLHLLLQVADSTITYRSRYLAVMSADYVLELLLSDETNPRSVAFQLESLFEHVGKLPEHESEGRYPKEQLIALKALTTVRLAAMPELSSRDSLGHYGALGDLLKRLQTDLYNLSDTLAAQFLRHVEASNVTSA